MERAINVEELSVRTQNFKQRGGSLLLLRWRVGVGGFNLFAHHQLIWLADTPVHFLTCCAASLLTAQKSPESLHEWSIVLLLSTVIVPFVQKLTYQFCIESCQQLSAVTMACATNLVKFILFGFNFLIVIGGAGLITIGALALSGFTEYNEFVDLSDYRAAPITTIVFGSIVFIIAFMGCCGVLRENNCMMMTYAFFLGLILLVQIGVVVAAHVYREDFEKVLTDGFTQSREKYGSEPEVTKNWDELQKNLKCCGVSSPYDWDKVQSFVPDSCCIGDKSNCNKGSPLFPSDEIYETGCVPKVLESLSVDRIVWPVAIVVAVELLGIIFGCCLAARFRDKRYHGHV